MRTFGLEQANNNLIYRRGGGEKGYKEVGYGLRQWTGKYDCFINNL
jgi:hypothetical protein